MTKPIAIGSDPNASALKEVLMVFLSSLGYEVDDYGSDDIIYANTAHKVAKAVAGGKHDRAVLLCGTGLGMCIAANKVPGAYAVTCTDEYSTERSILSNNANILTMGAKVVNDEIAKSLVTVWMSVQYIPGGRSQPKIYRIYAIEKEYTGSEK